MRVVFAYADLLESLKPIYRACASGLAENILKVFGQKAVHLADLDTDPIPGTEIMRFERKSPPMTWRLEVHALAHDVFDEILFTEPDVRFKEDISYLFVEPFDVTVSDRKSTTILKGEEAPPFTLGLNCSRSKMFWKEAAAHCSTLGRKDQLWGGDMKGLWHCVKSGKYNVRILDSDVYSRIPTGTEWPAEAKVMHYKGNRKTWLFPPVTEGAV